MTPWQRRSRAAPSQRDPFGVEPSPRHLRLLSRNEAPATRGTKIAGAIGAFVAFAVTGQLHTWPARLALAVAVYGPLWWLERRARARRRREEETLLPG